MSWCQRYAKILVGSPLVQVIQEQAYIFLPAVLTEISDSLLPALESREYAVQLRSRERTSKH